MLCLLRDAKLSQQRRRSLALLSLSLSLRNLRNHALRGTSPKWEITWRRQYCPRDTEEPPGRRTRSRRRPFRSKSAVRCARSISRFTSSQKNNGTKRNRSLFAGRSSGLEASVPGRPLAGAGGLVLHRQDRLVRVIAILSLQRLLLSHDLGAPLLRETEKKKKCRMTIRSATPSEGAPCCLTASWCNARRLERNEGGILW